MKLEELKTIEQLSQFLDGTQAVIFKLDTVKKKRYQWIRHELVRFDYMRMSKADRGIMKRYLARSAVTPERKSHASSSSTEAPVISNINRR